MRVLLFLACLLWVSPAMALGEGPTECSFPGGGCGGGGGGASDAADLAYSPNDTNDWDGNTDPGDGDSALDQLADRAKDLEDQQATEFIDCTNATNDAFDVDGADCDDWMNGADDALLDLQRRHALEANPSDLTEFYMRPAIVKETRSMKNFRNLAIPSDATVKYIVSTATGDGTGDDATNAYTSWSAWETYWQGLASGSRCNHVLYVRGSFDATTTGNADDVIDDDANNALGCTNPTDFGLAVITINVGETFSIDMEGTATTSGNIFTCDGVGTCYLRGARISNVTDTDCIDAGEASTNGTTNVYFYVVDTHCDNIISTSTSSNQILAAHEDSVIVAANVHGYGGGTNAGGNSLFACVDRSSIYLFSGSGYFDENDGANSRVVYCQQGENVFFDSTALVNGNASSSGSNYRVFEIDPQGSAETGKMAVIRSRGALMQGDSTNNNMFVIRANAASATSEMHVYETFAACDHTQSGDANNMLAVINYLDSSLTGTSTTLTFNGNAVTCIEETASAYTIDSLSRLYYDEANSANRTITALYNNLSEDTGTDAFTFGSSGAIDCTQASDARADSCSGGSPNASVVGNANFFDKFIASTMNETTVQGGPLPIYSGYGTAVMIEAMTQDYTYTFRHEIDDAMFGGTVIGVRLGYGELP